MDADGKADFTDDPRSRNRNILRLEERVQAIREYDRVPVFQKVADIMCCSAKQIRNIIQNRDTILLYYASKTGNCIGNFAKQDDRKNKINLLNKVMFEWIQRTQSREDVGRISTKLIRTIALDVKNQIKLPSFYPNTAWLESFMSHYSISEEDLISQKVYARCQEPKEHLSLKISDIIEDVKELRDKPESTVTYPYTKEESPSYDYKKEDSPLLFENSRSNDDKNFGAVDDFSYHDSGVIGVDEGEEERDTPPLKIRKVYSQAPTKKFEERKFITSYEDALKQLKPLEDFVLMEENFRAIGVISQLEAVFRNPESNQYQVD